MASKDLQLAIKKLNRLFNDRSSAEWWAQNIIDGTAHLTDPKDWTQIYSYMANPKIFDPNATVPAMSEEDVVATQKMLGAPTGFEEVRYQNGPEETIIHVRKTTQPNQDDEKVPA